MHINSFSLKPLALCAATAALLGLAATASAQTMANDGLANPPTATPKFRMGRSPAAEEPSKNALAEVQAAESLYQQGRNTQALEAYSALVGRYPRNAYFWFRLGNILTRENDAKSALNAFENAIALDPTDGRFHFNVAVLQMSMARSSFEAAANLLPANQTAKQEAQHMLEALLTIQDGTAPKCNQVPAACSLPAPTTNVPATVPAPVVEPTQTPTQAPAAGAHSQTVAP